MTITAPTPDPGNAPEGILEPPEPVVVDALAPIDLVTMATLPDYIAQQVANSYPPAIPDTTAPGVYTDGVLTANVDATGAIVPIPEPTP